MHTSTIQRSKLEPKLLPTNSRLQHNYLDLFNLLWLQWLWLSKC